VTVIYHFPTCAVQAAVLCGSTNFFVGAEGCGSAVVLRKVAEGLGFGCRQYGSSLVYSISGKAVLYRVACRRANSGFGAGYIYFVKWQHSKIRKKKEIKQEAKAIQQREQFFYVNYTNVRSFKVFNSSTDIIGVPRILQWRVCLHGGGPGQGPGERNPPAEAEAKCEINVQFFTFSCIKFMI